MAVKSRADNEPLIKVNPALQTYYQSLESRIGYQLLLGGTRHFGYYDRDTYWPFPIGRSLRRMEEKLFELLSLPPGSRVLDAGCGVAHVAIYLARRGGLRITGIDVIDHHIAKARRNIARARLLSPHEGQVSVQKMDYHHLETLAPDSFDGVYTLETFVHATDPQAALAGFFRILKPGGRLALFEYEHVDYNNGTDFDRSDTTMVDMLDWMKQVNRYAAMPTNEQSTNGYLKRLLLEAGFEDVEVHDYSENIRPMLRLFWILAVVPCMIIKFLRLEKHFVNTLAGARGYVGQQYWSYVAVAATKPGPPLEAAKVK